MVLTHDNFINGIQIPKAKLMIQPHGKLFVKNPVLADNIKKFNSHRQY